MGGAALFPYPADGLILTAGVLAVVLAAVNFLGLVRDVVAGTVLTAVDERVVALMPHLRTPAQTAFFAFCSSAADNVTVVLGLLVLILMSWRAPALRPVAGLLVTAWAAKTVVSTVVQHLVGRPRPDRTLALVTETGPGFPSGHALTATVMGGLVAYLLVRAAHRPAVRLVVLLSVLPAIGLVGLSRIYLGAHYPSDVLGGLLLGVVLLVPFVTAAEIDRRHHVLSAVGLHRAAVRPVLVAVLTAAVFAGAAGAWLTPLQAVPGTVATTALPGIDASTLQQLPHYSETLTGAPMEPIGFVYIGTQDQLEHRFARAEWYRADPWTPATTLQAVVVALRGQQYATAPVTPAYLAAEPETLAFEQPTDTNTLAQRHHTRIWRTRFTVDGRPVWAATASLDQGAGLVGAARLPTHHIDPDVDAERTHILRSLGITRPELVQVVDPQLGHNASGEAFFTDGKAAVVDLDTAPGQVYRPTRSSVPGEASATPTGWC
ncbi:hypothetical protein AUQ48_11790 [Kocuria flava]|uniref:Phosphatidic acid phosphatase type 2/haloperoxidase domain-containing protein n=1 Tax=Kocuria flava TaxID=446860 RepID=A0A2N4T3G6_9MICC|nr:LssY C-terminal domain-containing protein [Kocuria flava]PLC12778.1 hypothetical protein AUQ48_11790 [Kocuria flava]